MAPRSGTTSAERFLDPSLTVVVESGAIDAEFLDTELVLRAERAGLRTVELPVVVVERRPSRSPIWRRVPRTLWGLVRLRVRLWRDRGTGTEA